MKLTLDRAAASVACGAVVVLQLLLFSAGWLIGAFAGTPIASAPPPPSPEHIEPARTIDAPSSRIVELAPTPIPRPAPKPLSFEELIHRAARHHGVSPLLVQAVTKVESDFNPRDLSQKGARGLMQVMPATGARFGVPAERLFDPAPNIAAGTAYLAWLLDRYRGDLDLTLAAYNAGEGAVDQYGGIPPYRETQTYVKKVRSELQKMQGLDEQHWLAPSRNN